MKLQKNISRRTKGKVYAKWILTVPEETVKDLGWRQGTELKAEVLEGKLVLSEDGPAIKAAKVSITGKGLSYFERFMLVYNSLPLAERKMPVVVIDGEPINWAMTYLEIKNRTPLGKKIGEKLIKLDII